MGQTERGSGWPAAAAMFGAEGGRARRKGQAHGEDRFYVVEFGG